MKTLTKYTLITIISVLGSSLILAGYTASFNYDAKHNISFPIEMMKTTQFNASTIINNN